MAGTEQLTRGCLAFVLKLKFPALSLFFRVWVFVLVGGFYLFGVFLRHVLFVLLFYHGYNMQSQNSQQACHQNLFPGAHHLQENGKRSIKFQHQETEIIRLGCISYEEDGRDCEVLLRGRGLGGQGAAFPQAADPRDRQKQGELGPALRAQEGTACQKSFCQKHFQPLPLVKALVFPRELML